MSRNVLVYGSLREGQYNRIGYEMKAVGRYRLPGLQLRSLGSFPAAELTGNPEHELVVEENEVNEENKEYIDRLERGYQKTIINIDGKEKILYTFPDSSKQNGYGIHLGGRDVVGHGDWSAHRNGTPPEEGLDTVDYEIVNENEFI